MEKINQTLYYKRNAVNNIVMKRSIKKLKVGDIIQFYGKLYDSKDYTRIVAKTIIIYKILLITPNGVLIETSNKYMFNNGTAQFSGNIFSSNFDINDDILNSYNVKPSILSFVEGTKKYKNALGYNKYKITGHGLGEITIHLDLIKK